jgi:peptidoglycan/LPS O-acetylase OafA/YrhL
MTSRPALLPEIQGLRAVAVGLVLLFHVWPAVVPGGYVGVDVFFVISGFLITGLLARMALSQGRISLIEFYSRRIRRLLPAAMTVLVVTALCTILFIPEDRWGETAQQIAASATYVQNWMLAWLSVDYLGAAQVPSPVQHYWSLSIEEQFYLVWPLLMIATMAVARQIGVPMRRALVASLAVIFVLSLVASIAITAANPAQAYFVTQTRVWELALGGLLALTIHRFEAGMIQRAGLLLLGLVAVGTAALTFSTKTAFPGYAALLPTVGAALVILAGDVRIGTFRGLNATALGYIGDRSYSIYLWHFPLVTLYLVGHPHIGLLDGLGIVALTLALSHFTFRYIEQRYRYPRAKAELRPVFFGAASIAACLVASAAIDYTASQTIPTINPGDPRYPGPAALLADAPVPAHVPLVPTLATLTRDLPVVYPEKCHQDQVSAEPIHCDLGDPKAGRTMVVFGDSHAAQWVPTLQRIAAEDGWRLVTFTKSYCAFARITVISQGKPYTSCSEWRENVIAAVKQLHPQIVFTSQARYQADKTTMINGIESTWRELNSAGAKVIAIDNTPEMPFNPGDCIAETPGKCSASLVKSSLPDYFGQAADNLPGVTVLNMTDGICGPVECDAIVGNMVVWRDYQHLTATYAAALAPYFEKRAGLSGTGAVASATTGNNGAVQSR